jgi:hypothetical protein
LAGGALEVPLSVVVVTGSVRSDSVAHAIANNTAIAMLSEKTILPFMFPPHCFNLDPLWSYHSQKDLVSAKTLPQFPYQSYLPRTMHCMEQDR